MENEALLVLAAGVVVEMLLLIGRSQRGDGERLSFAAGENGGAVNAWQGANFAVKRAKVADRTAVCAHAFFHDRNAERFLLEVFEGLLDIEVGGFRSALLDGGLDFVAQGSDFLGALGLRRRVDGRLDAIAGDFISDLKEVFLGEDLAELALGLAGEFHELFLHFNQLGDGLLCEVEDLMNSSSGSSSAWPSIMMTSVLLPT